MDREYTHFGEEAWERAALLNLSSPFERKKINDLNLFETILNRTFINKLGLNSLKECNLLTVDDLFEEEQQREKQSELYFETFEVKGFHICPSPFLSCFSSGKKSAVVVECGHSSTVVFPVIEGLYFVEFLSEKKVSLFFKFEKMKVLKRM